MINNIGANSSLSRMPFMRNVTKTMPNLSDRESEILGELREKISSQFGVPVKISHGTRGESGLNVAFTGFMGGFFNGENRAEMFLITPSMLAEMAESEYRHSHWMDWIQETAMRQQEHGMVFPSDNRQREEADAERRSQQIKANMMTALDFWNENNEGHWTQLGQGQAIQQKIGGLL
jgi:hypothetical protein